MSTLVLAEYSNGRLKSGTLSAISAATAIGAEVVVLVAGTRGRGAAEQASRTAGVDKVLLVDAAHLDAPVAEDLAALIRPIVEQGHGHLLADASSLGRSVLPRVAASLDVGMVSDVIAVLAPDRFKRPIYAGNAIATVEALDAVKVLTVRASAFTPAVECETAAGIEVLGAPPAGGMARLVEQTVSVSTRPDLANARIVVSGGRGLQSKDNFAMVERLADKLGAAVGASRAAVDAGYASNDLQVGQTGKIVAPELYIAAGISGAIQHLAGMSGSKVIVAINQDAEAPIAQVADYMLVADLFEALPAFEKALG